MFLNSRMGLCKFVFFFNFTIIKLSILYFVLTFNFLYYRDCGIYMLAFAKYLSYGQGIPANILVASCLRSRYATLLWNYDQQKNDAGAISDNEAPPRHSRFNVAMEEIDTIQID